MCSGFREAPRYCIRFAILYRSLTLRQPTTFGRSRGPCDYDQLPVTDGDVADPLLNLIGHPNLVVSFVISIAMSSSQVLSHPIGRGGRGQLHTAVGEECAQSNLKGEPICTVLIIMMG